MRFGFVSGSYTSRSPIVGAEECINLYCESVESQGTIAPAKAYGGSTASSQKALYGTPGLKVFTTLPQSPTRAQFTLNGREFAIGGSTLYELSSAAVQTVRGTISTDDKPVSVAATNTQMLIVSAGRAYCYTFATNALVEVTSSLAGTPAQVDATDTYFIVSLAGTDKFQMSGLLDGTTWPPIEVDAVSRFPENLVSIIVNHGELMVFGSRHMQPYQDTGSLSVFDPIPGTLQEQGCCARFSPCRVDNSVFWVGEDERGARVAWRLNGYSPQRISTYAVEFDLASYADVSGMVTYSYQDSGHLFWVLYIPGAQWSWVYDVTEQLWHKRASWNGSAWGLHWSWNHAYCFGKHLVGDWNSGNIYEMNEAFLDDNGTAIRRLRRSPTVISEMEWISHVQLTIDLETGLSPAYPLVDGNGFARAPQVMLRWSDDRCKNWSNEHILNCGLAGQYNTRVIQRRLGRSRYRVYELSMTDPVSWTINDAYLVTA